jgi:type I restriction-modification system DNA methylase subunit
MPYKKSIEQKEAQKRHYQLNKDAYHIRSNERRKRIRAEYEAFKRTLKCQQCGENHQCCLAFHHRDPNEKEKGISQVLSDTQSMNRILAEVEKCDVLCFNCHAKLHWNLSHPGV